VQRSHDRASGEEIGAPAPQLAGAGSGEHEAPSILRFEIRVDDAEEVGHALNLVQHDRCACGRSVNQVVQPLGTGGELAGDVGLADQSGAHLGLECA
jgi:hypothetical protein